MEDAMEEIGEILDSMGSELFLATDAIDSMLETRALSVLSGRRGFNVEGEELQKAGGCGICGEGIEVGEYARALVSVDPKKPVSDGYPNLVRTMFHDDCVTRAMLYMFPQALVPRVVSMGMYDESVMARIVDPKARKELIEEMMEFQYEECGCGCDDDCECGEDDCEDCS